MGFAFDEATGLPVIVEPQEAEQRLAPPPLTLHVQPEPPESREIEIADIMLKVQKFADEAAEDARRQARTVVADAQVEAASIVSRARREAEEIAAQATPRVAPEAVTELCTAIGEFAETNRILVEELVQLREALAGSYADTPVSPHGHLSSMPPVAG
jgi:hypothetical protein